MKITKVSYGRTIEVGGPFGRRPVEKVWFGWEMQLDEGDTEDGAMETMHTMADKLEKEEKELYRQRRHRAALERALALPPHRRNSYEHELVVQHEERGHFVVCKTTVRVREGDSFLQHSSRDEIVWGAYETAHVSTSKLDAAAYAHRRGVTDYEILPGPDREGT